MKIDSIKLKSLRNDGHFQFITEFRDLVCEQTAEALKIKPQFDAFLTLYAREDEALRKVPASALTPKIREADAARDETLTGMCETNKGTCKHWIPATRDAARRVQVALNAYKHIANKPINEQTSAVYNLAQELNSGKYAADTQTAGLTGWVNELQRRNNIVESLVKERFSESASKTDVILRDARRETDTLYWNICDLVNAHALIEGGTAYETFIRTLNEVIRKYSVKHPKNKNGGHISTSLNDRGGHGGDGGEAGE
jgi:hypothetical protein